MISNKKLRDDLMIIDKKFDGNCLRIMLKGRLDTNSAPILEESLTDNFQNINSLILDFEELMYISSAGLRVIILIHKKIPNDCEMSIENVNDIIMEVFDTTGFSNVLSINQ